MLSTTFIRIVKTIENYHKFPKSTKLHLIQTLNKENRNFTSQANSTVFQQILGQGFPVTCCVCFQAHTSLYISSLIIFCCGGDGLHFAVHLRSVSISLNHTTMRYISSSFILETYHDQTSDEKIKYESAYTYCSLKIFFILVYN